jgi:hypothetical protein
MCFSPAYYEEDPCPRHEWTSGLDEPIGEDDQDLDDLDWYEHPSLTASERNCFIR